MFFFIFSNYTVRNCVAFHASQVRIFFQDTFHFKEETMVPTLIYTTFLKAVWTQPTDMFFQKTIQNFLLFTGKKFQFFSFRIILKI